MYISSVSIKSDKVIMPMPAGTTSDADRILYHCFIGHIRQIPTSQTEIKILSAIQFTSDMLGFSDAHVSKVLVEMGLRAPRLAYPMEFLDYIDGALMRCGWNIGAPTAAMIELRDYWYSCGEKLSNLPFRHIQAILKEDVIQI